jgi:V8-like Glu-specific endopeptidase
MTALPLKRSFVIIVAICAWIAGSAEAQERLRSIAELQVNASLAAAERATSETEDDDESRDRLAGLRVTRDELLDSARGLRATPINPLDNQPPGTVLIVNGVSTFAFGATGALLKKDEDGVLRVNCSGTMIGCETFLTARHCVDDDLTSENYHVYLQSEGIFEVHDILPKHPHYEEPFADLQLLTLAARMTAVKPAQINSTQSILSATQGTIVGFGHTKLNENDHGIKRFGAIETQECLNIFGAEDPEGSKGLLCWLYDQNKATTCHVDSGGPMFLGASSNDGVMAGVTSKGDASCLSDAQNIDVDLQFFAPWLAKTGGEDVGQLSCTPPGRGDIESVKALAAENAVTQTDPPKIYPAISLTPDMREIRIGLNGEDRPENDLDLSVIVNSNNGDTPKWCSEAGPENFAFCRFELEESDASMTVVVSQKGSGSGIYQLLVTALSYSGIPR